MPGIERVGKEKYKKGISENFEDLMKTIDSQIKYALSRMHQKQMCTTGLIT